MDEQLKPSEEALQLSTEVSVPDSSSGQDIKSIILDRFRKLNENVNKTTEEKTAGSEKSSSGSKKDNALKRKFESENFHPGLTDSDVGIEEFISNLNGFSGIIKHRFSDFQVHEIDKQGNIVELRTWNIPVFPQEEDAVTLPENYKEALKEETWESLNKLRDTTDKTAFVDINVSGLTKLERSVIHNAIKAEYNQKFYTRMTSKENIPYIRVGRAPINRDVSKWPRSVKEQFLHFTVFKENFDTASVVNQLAKRARIKANLITYAGTKDKRGKTTQRMCIKRRKAEEIKRIDRYSFGITFGDFSYEDKCLKLGDLSGNRFTLAIRNVTADDKEIVEGLEFLKENGFINYFGLQRFGCYKDAPTFMIGKAIFSSKWQEAVNLILKPKGKSAPRLMDACKCWAKTNDPSLALKYIKHDNYIEAVLLRALKKSNKNWFNALFALPRNTLLLYLHAYQSYVWNRVVSKRIKEFGMQPLVGDLVFDTEEKADGNYKEEILQCLEPEDVTFVQQPGSSEEALKSDQESDAEEEAPLKENGKEVHQKVKVKILKVEDLATVKMKDIIYPIPGFDIEYPENKIFEWYKEILAEDDFTMEVFEKSNKSFSLYGAYRKIIGTVTDLSWEIVPYNDVNKDLILSDLDKMKGITLNKETDDDKKHKAVLLDFKLVPSCYATMLLRELMKCDTSMSYHANLTKTLNEDNREARRKKLKADNVEAK